MCLIMDESVYEATIRETSWKPGLVSTMCGAFMDVQKLKTRKLFQKGKLYDSV